MTAHVAADEPADRLPVRFQRAENLFVSIAAAVAFVEADFTWWWLFAIFLVFDLSMLGYAGGPRLGAWTYNVVHSYVGPAALGAVAVVGGARWTGFLALAWAFHIAVDRMLGYGLKFTDRFNHTHLGDIGKEREEDAATDPVSDER